jgi:hypothetical protein
MPECGAAGPPSAPGFGDIADSASPEPPSASPASRERFGMARALALPLLLHRLYTKSLKKKGRQKNIMAGIA